MARIRNQPLIITKMSTAGMAAYSKAARVQASTGSAWNAWGQWNLSLAKLTWSISTMNMAMRRNSSKLLSRVWRRLLISSWMLLELDAQHGDSGGFGSGDSGCGVFEGYGVGGTEAEVA